MSIDVALGASISSLIFYTLTGNSVHLPSIIALALAVWLIYTLDHLIDAKRIKIEAVLPRHRYHQKHFTSILSVWMIILFISIFFTLKYLFIPTLYLGFLGLFLVGIHFGLVRLFGFKVSPFIQKEFGVALIYTLGISIPALSMNLHKLSYPVIVVFIQVFLLAGINLLEFSFFEISKDKQEEQTSLARVLGERKIQILIYGLIICNFFLMVVNTSLYPQKNNLGVELCILTMNIILLLILMYKDFFRKNERYRVLGDGIFFIPIFLLFLQ